MFPSSSLTMLPHILQPKQLCSPTLFDTTLPGISPQPNVKWLKIKINSIPMGKVEGIEPYTLETCHNNLAAENPVYTSLGITQKPSWICHPLLYENNTVSSLIVAFEDPDGSKLREFLTTCQLCLLGTHARVMNWKQTPNPPYQTPLSNCQQGMPIAWPLQNECLRNPVHRHTHLQSPQAVAHLLHLSPL